jgi:cysteine-rich repeat protein
VSPTQVDACLDPQSGLAVADGTACAYPGQAEGACDHGVCHAILCGNGVREPGEVCDDGNTADRDACSGDCRSTEACGNGTTDLAVDEECDDGNFRSHDGCSSRCTIEVVSWRQLGPPNRPGDQAHQMAFDAHRGVVVVFGGRTPTGQAANNTLEFRGGQWVETRPLLPPQPRIGHTMAYDAARRVTVVFGGEDVGTLYGDTSTYDGRRWVAMSAAVSPTARSQAAMAYDGAHAQVVLFGGRTASGPSAETWLWDGAAWSQSAASGPVARFGHVMAYDAARQRVVLFGGRAQNAILHDTWEWNGAAWVETTPATLPEARGAMTYDAGAKRVVLFGGRDVTSNATWTYAGGDWSALPAAPTALAKRIDTAIAYDAVRKRAVLYAGGVGLIGAAFTDTWELVGDTWTEAVLESAPEPRNWAGFVVDERSDDLLLFAGSTPPATIHSDTWRFDGLSWSELAPTGSPGSGPCPNGDCFMGSVWDSARQRVVFVRRGPPAEPVQTWEYLANAWARITTATAPPSVILPATVYDRKRDRVVLFGGDVKMQASGATWEFDGTTWAAAQPAASPPGRFDMAAAWDATRERVVIFGGRSGMTHFADTWAYDGVTWVQLATSAPAPSARSNAALVHDPIRGTLLLFAGEAGTTPASDLWELDGDTWRVLVPGAGPGPRHSPRLVFDRARYRTVLHGGDPQNDTWALAWTSTIPDEVCSGDGDGDGDGLAACADPDCDGARCAVPGGRCVAGACVCPGGASESRCGDDFDDDCDGLVDCADPDCSASVVCSAEASCQDGVDDDGDRRSDCADPGCDGVGACEVIEESCDDGGDNDGDGRSDCADPDCFLRPCPEVP